MRLPTRAAALLTPLAVLALLGACAAGPAEPEAPAAKPERTAAAEPTPTPTPTPTPEPAPTEVGVPAELTPEGGELDLGAEAVVQIGWGLDPAGDAYYDAQFASRVVGVRPADPAALAEVDISGYDPATHVAYYVDSAHRLLWARGNQPLLSVYAPTLYGWDSTGSPASSLLVFGTFPGCQGGSFEEPTVGAEITSCDIVAVPLGESVGYAGVVGNPQVSQDAHAEITTTPLVWRTS
ncbi:hypothetical protein [Actinotalea solisilvae]|uniref:hypothetical protein n=1 Tax=Actinotalea solisilvae TaxID=2072922 RepID=UPI0018F1369B|nr:hypothetical protein [Actinotalea solisilvae]